MKQILLLAFSLLCTILFPTFINNTTLQFSNSLFSVLFFAALYLFVRYAYSKKFSRRMFIFTHVLGFLFSVMTAFGYSLEHQGFIDFLNIPLILSIFAYTHVFSLLLCIFWTFIEKAEPHLFKQQYPASLSKIVLFINKLFDKPYFMILILLLCWLPCYISTFPGGFRYDATEEFEQLLKGFSGDFPLLHSFIITRLLSIFYTLTGSYNVGIAIYTILQMLILSAMFVHILTTLYKSKTNNILLVILFVYYALFPVIHLLVTCTVRDVLFSGLLTYCVFLFYQMTLHRDCFMKSPKKVIALGLVLVLTLLSRNNNIGLILPAILAAISIAVFLFAGKQNRKGALVFLGTVIGSYLIASLLLVQFCQPLTPANKGSAFSLVSQCMVRAYMTTGEQWPEKDVERFEKYISTENLAYVAENGDSTKWHLRSFYSADFIRFFAKIGVKYPGTYMNAILANTRQMWFPPAIVDGYQESNISSYSSYDKCYFSFSDKIASPGTHQQYLPTVREFYKNIGLMISFEKIPVISMLFSIGFHFWALLNCIFYIEYRKCRYLRLPLLILLGYTLISAFVPLVLLRYFSALFFAFPLIVAFFLQPSKNHVFHAQTTEDFNL